MKIELKGFQEKAARDIIAELDEARVSVAKGKVQAVILSAPTGSGKTITLAEVIDLTFGGGDGILERPETVFLWLSDSPELNTQSKNKLLGACDHLPFHRMVTIESDNFDESSLESGYVYFINTQLLGKDKILTKEPGDRRKFTFWQTLANTIARAPQNFVLIIDEAHRGASASERVRIPIMQKFILGSPADGLPPVPLVLGMSATPQRFTTLLGNTNRTQRPINIDPEEVRLSGLLKDWIIVRNPKADVAGDLTLLEEATKSWCQFTKLWDAYCSKEGEKEIVRPILVVQVEDGAGDAISRSPLADIVRVIERQHGKLAVNEIVHCFQEQSDIEVGGRIIRKLDASRIQDTPDVKVVLFKTALTTGWDCPRAEVMMSFRRAQDATTIAQLVGRMVRTPLARRITVNEVLDTVELFLPHYNSKALEEVLNRLRSPEAEEGLPARVETSVAQYHRDPEMARVFGRLSSLQTYSVSRVPKMGDIKRLLRLGGLLVHEGVASDADEEIREALLAALNDYRRGYESSVPNWTSLVREGGEIEVDVTRVATGKMNIAGAKTARLVLSEENVNQLFDGAGRLLASGEGLHRSYWKRYQDKSNPNRAKLELFAIVQQPDTLLKLADIAKKEFDVLWVKHRSDIQKLGASVRSRFHALVQASGRAVVQDWELPNQVVEKIDGAAWKKHLYIDAEGGFSSELNTWEKELLDAEMAKPDFVGWLRNLPRREWALCVPYELGGLQSFYPDFIIVKKSGKSYAIDMLEPHDDSRTDTWAKAKGLASYADEHGMDFGRLVIARKKSGKWQFADMNDPGTREKARKMSSANDLESLFSK